MTKKDYILLAAALKRARPAQSAQVERYNAWLDCVIKITMALAAERDKAGASFDKTKFYGACGACGACDKP